MNELQLAQLYLSKGHSAKNKSIEFELTFAQFKKLQQAKTCYYTGIELTKSNGHIKQTDRTLDRVDASQGYLHGNVVACCHAVNQLKGTWEGPNSILDLASTRMIFDRLAARDLDKQEAS